MNKRLVIIGAGGHGKVIADIAVKRGYENIIFADDDAHGECLGFSIVCTCEELQKLNDGKTDFIIAVGDNKIRKSIAEKYKLNWVSLIHPSAQIGIGATVDIGTVVMAGAIINPCAAIGKHCIINTSSVVEHENAIEDYVHISPKAALGGNVHIGKSTHIGIGATVINNIEICDNCTIGAGAVVVKDIKESATYIGIPAKKSVVMGGG